MKHFRPTTSGEYLSTWFDPTAVPSAPILSVSRPLTYPLAVHWWNAATTCTTDAPAASPSALLPQCGFFPPSSSFSSVHSDTMPWVAATGLDTAWPETPKTPRSPPVKTGGTAMLRSLSGARPLMRVSTINRKEGRNICRRRRIEKGITPEELIVGLGLMLCDRSTSVTYEVVFEVVKEVVEEHRLATWKMVRTLTEEVEDSDDEDW
ncbi:hypothetical protein DXG01_003632 [Tephrocybe rancida]|nr:hypothetical protein DXG01_003632 [Tephrocybe rancida]